MIEGFLYFVKKGKPMFSRKKNQMMRGFVSKDFPPQPNKKPYD